MIWLPISGFLEAQCSRRSKKGFGLTCELIKTTSDLLPATFRPLKKWQLFRSQRLNPRTVYPGSLSNPKNQRAGAPRQEISQPSNRSRITENAKYHFKSHRGHRLESGDCDPCLYRDLPAHFSSQKRQEVPQSRSPLWRSSKEARSNYWRSKVSDVIIRDWAAVAGFFAGLTCYLIGRIDQRHHDLKQIRICRSQLSLNRKSFSAIRSALESRGISLELDEGSGVSGSRDGASLTQTTTLRFEANRG